MFSGASPSSSLLFTAIALTLMIFFKVFVIDGIDQYRMPDNFRNIETRPENAPVIIEQDASIPFQALPKAAITSPRIIARDMNVLETGLPQPEVLISAAKPVARHDRAVIKASVPEVIDEKISLPEPQKQALPAYKKRAGQTSKIVIIIDDMGLARSNSHAIIDLPAPLTLAFLPYADRLEEFTGPALEKGHELIIHVPMEPMGVGHNLGPAGLTTKLSKEEFKAILNNHVFPSFTGYVGINNHMGSRLTQNKQAMGWVMEELKARGLYFVDSKTIGSSIAARTAMDYGIPFAERDVFLDHYDTYDSVMKALASLEAVAHRQGVAIAIGHPKKHTIDALRNWMPGIAGRGLELVPASSVLHKPDTQDIHVSEPQNAPVIKAEIEGPHLPEAKNYYMKEFKTLSSDEKTSEALKQIYEPRRQIHSGNN